MIRVTGLDVGRVPLRVPVVIEGHLDEDLVQSAGLVLLVTVPGELLRRGERGARGPLQVAHVARDAAHVDLAILHHLARLAKHPDNREREGPCSVT